MAASTTVFSTSPLAGMKLSQIGSAVPAADTSVPFTIPALTKVNGSDGHVYMVAHASEAIGSITTCVIGTAGSASSDAGSAGWTANAPGGAAANQLFWVKRTTLA